ncbi:MAG TPA: hypothetical protein VLE23_20035 [Geminicoccaceae bacterium]|nr:hypothetical protein [Geminicoccaceae bacterium]
MSTLWHCQPAPLRELVRAWCVAHTTPDQLLAAIFREIRTGVFDKVDGGRPGVLVDNGEDGIPITGAQVCSDISEFASRGLSGEEKVICGLMMTKAAIVDFARRYELDLPPGVTAAPPPAAAAEPLNRAAAEARTKQYLAAQKSAGKSTARRVARGFAQREGFPIQWAEAVQRQYFPGKGGRPAGSK